MNNTKKNITIYVLALIAVMFIGNTSVYASEVTGIISSSTSFSSQSGGDIGGSVGGGSVVSGTLGGASGGSTIAGTVSGSGGGSNISGSVSGGGGSGSMGQINPGDGFVLGASTVLNVPGLPNTGIRPVNSIVTTLMTSMVLFMVLLISFMAYEIFTLGRRKIS